MVERARRVTINDVARLAGVSRGAVSRAMNGGERLSAETVERVHRAAQQLGWRPSAAARAVNGAPAHVIGFVVRRSLEVLDGDPFFSAFIQGVESAAVQSQYSFMIRFVRDHIEEREAYQVMAVEAQVAGVLVNDLRADADRFELLRSLGVPCIAVGTPSPDWGVAWVDHAPEPAMEAVAAHLAELGHRTIGHVVGDPTYLHGASRRVAFADACVRHGLTRIEASQVGYSRADAVSATRELLASPTRPTAIFYPNDAMALLGMRELGSAGLRVPEDLSVVGFGGSFLSTVSQPTLTTVKCDYVELGRVAAEMLLDPALRQSAEGRQLASHLVVAESSRAWPT